MTIEHEVWAVPPGGDTPTWYASFDLDRWQWAIKFAGYLEDRGCTDVEVVLEVDAEEYEEEDEGEAVVDTRDSMDE